MVSHSSGVKSVLVDIDYLSFLPMRQEGVSPPQIIVEKALSQAVTYYSGGIRIF